MSNKGGRVSPDYLADIAPEYAYYPNVGYQTTRFFINSGVVLFDFKMIKEGDLSITPDRRKTLVFLRKSQVTCF